MENLKNYGIVRTEIGQAESELVETSLTKEQAETLQKEYALSEKNNPKVSYIIGNGKVFE